MSPLRSRGARPSWRLHSWQSARPMQVRATTRAGRTRRARLLVRSLARPDRVWSGASGRRLPGRADSANARRRRLLQSRLSGSLARRPGRVLVLLKSSTVALAPPTATLEKPALSAADFRFGPIVSSGAASTPPDACSDSALGRSAAAGGMRHAKPAKEGRRERPGVSRMQGRPAEASSTRCWGRAGIGESRAEKHLIAVCAPVGESIGVLVPCVAARAGSAVAFLPFSVLGNGYCLRTGRTAGEAITAVRVEGRISTTKRKARASRYC